MEQPQLSASELSRLREIIDRADIEQVINDYFHAMDTRNFDLLDKVFAPDITYTASMIGCPAVTINGFEDVASAIRLVGEFRTSHHGVRNQSINIRGDTANVVLVAMDALHDSRPLDGDTAPGGRVIQHGLRYIDVFQKRREGWRIRSRELHCLWQIVSVNPAYDDRLPGAAF